MEWVGSGRSCHSELKLDSLPRTTFDMWWHFNFLLLTQFSFRLRLAPTSLPDWPVLFSVACFSSYPGVAWPRCLGCSCSLTVWVIELMGKKVESVRTSAFTKGWHKLWISSFVAGFRFLMFKWCQLALPLISVTFFSIRNTMPDYGCEVIAEALAQRALVKPVYTFPIIPLSNSNQYRHQDHLDMKDYKKVSLLICPMCHFLSATGCEWALCVSEQNVCTSTVFSGL